MATTRIIPMHLNKGKTLAQCLADRTEYGMNPDKTEGGALISAFACEPETAVSEFALSKREYRELTGRVQESDVIAYQVRQSFKPGEVTPEEANRIGYEFAKRFLKGRHAFLVCTHTDKKHIHNHIYWNSTALDCTKKFKNFIGSYRAVRRLSDLICAEHRLSVVENPQKHGLSYNKWRGGHDKLSNRDLLRMAIDAALEKQPGDFDALLALLKAQGYYNAFALVAGNNRQSNDFHRAMGFKKMATEKRTGYKFGQWLDLDYWVMVLHEGGGEPQPVRKTLTDAEIAEAMG